MSLVVYVGSSSWACFMIAASHIPLGLNLKSCILLLLLIMSAPGPYLNHS